MKRIISLIGLLFIIQHTSAQPQWQWGVNSSRTSEDWGSVIATDKAGNVYVSGIFTNTITLDTITLTSLGAKDVFLAKYNASGQIIWAKSCGSVAEETVDAIAIDSSDNVYLTGSFGAHVTYPVTYTDTAYFSGTSVVSNGNQDIFLAKYNGAGNVIWVRNFGGMYDDVRSRIVITKSQKILLTGTFGLYGGSPPVYSTIIFDSFLLTSGGNGDIFMTCASTIDGHVEWAKAFGKSSNELSASISADSQKNIYLAGNFSSQISIGGINLSSISSGTVGGDNFLAKFDTSGKTLWARQIGGTNSSTIAWGVVGIKTISVSASGNVYVTGTYHYCTFRMHNGSSLPYMDQFQIFLVKYDTHGNVVWARQMGGPSWDGVGGMWMDKDENVYLTGLFHDDAVFGNDTLIAYGSDDAFIAKYDSAGNKKWVLQMGGSSNESGAGITRRADGSIYVTGDFNSSVFNYGGSTLTNSGSWDMFLVKLADPTSVEELHFSNHDVQLYPNPTTGVLNIQSRKQDFTEVRILDRVGRTVFSQLLKEKQTLFQLDFLPDGMYHVQLKGDESIVTKKLIIQH